VRKCDALIVIVGHRYGWVPTKKDGGDGVKSITWWEVKWALDAGKPVYAFLVDPKATWTSFACAILAGTVALMLKVNPKLTPDRVRDILGCVGPVALNAESESTKVSGNLKVLDACEAVREAAENVKVKPAGNLGSRKKSRRPPGTAKARRSR